MLINVRRRNRVVVLTALLGTLIGPLAFAQSTFPDYKKLIARYGKKSIQATVGTYCVPKPDGTGDCQSAESYPLKTKGRLTVSRGGTITLLFGAPAGDVMWRAARLSKTGREVGTGYGRAVVVTKTGKRWKIKLPKDLRRSSTIIGIEAQSTNAYASFEFAVKVR